MADPIVGASIQEQQKPTDVPGGASVPKEVGMQQQASDIPAGYEQVGQQASQPRSDIPAGFEEVGGEDVIIEDMPAYANGSSPFAAINRSPLSFADRLKLAAGNKVGQLKYLKQNYEDANIDKHGNIQVKKDGMWYQVDPSGTGEGDAWQRTKELVKDMAADNADVIAQVLGGGAGAIAGAAAGPAGALAGGAAGAGGAEAVRTSLGRLVGTYDATPEQQMKDIGWEAMLGLGGEAVALGAKPGIKMAWNALKNTEIAATNYGKEVLSAAYAGLTGQPRWAFRRAMDGADNVLSKTELALKELGPGKSPLEAVDIAQRHQNNILTELAAKSDAALKGNYRRHLGELLSNTKETFSFDSKFAMESAMNDMAEQGLGRLVKVGDRVKFKVVDDKELAELFGTSVDQLPKILGPKTREAMTQVADIVNKYASYPTLTGKQGAKLAVDFKRAVRESFDGLVDDSTPPQVKAVVGKILNGAEQRIGQSFADAGSIDAYLKMNKEYATHADAVKMLKKAVESRNPNEVDNFVKKLVSKAGSYRQLKDESQALGNLLGMDRVQELVDWEASKSFLDFVPKSNASEGLASSLIKGVLGSTVAAPRAAGAQIKYANKTLDFIKSLGPRQAAKLLSNDKALAQALSMGGQLASQESDELNKLLKSAGVDEEQQ